LRFLGRQNRSSGKTKERGQMEKTEWRAVENSNSQDLLYFRKGHSR
jgi:hypothetical protein